LRRSEAYLAEAQRLSHCGVTAYKGSTVFYGSEEIYRIWGFDPAQGVPGRKAVLQRIHPDDRDRLNAVVERARSMRRDVTSAAYRIVLPDGTVKHLESIGQPCVLDKWGAGRGGRYTDRRDRAQTRRGSVAGKRSKDPAPGRFPTSSEFSSGISTVVFLRPTTNFFAW